MDKVKEYFWQYKDLKKRIEVILKNYRATVDYYYSDLKDSNPDYFKMYNSAKVGFVAFHNNPTWSGVAFYFGANEKSEDEIKEVDLPVDYISSYSNIPDDKIGSLIAKKLHILDILYKEPIMMPKVNILAFTNDGSLGQSFANEEAKKWKNDSTTSNLGYLLKRWYTLVSPAKVSQGCPNHIKTRLQLKEAGFLFTF